MKHIKKKKENRKNGCKLDEAIICISFWKDLERLFN